MKLFLSLGHLAIIASGAALDRGRSIHGGRMFLAGGMQPVTAATTLVSVEEEWQSFAKASVECHAKDGNFQHCQQAKNDFSKSCGTVLNAIVQGSSGDQNKVKTYMNTVCAEPQLQGWHQKLCVSVEDGLDKAMMFNANDNRVRFHSDSICNALWSEFVDLEQNRVAKEREDEKEQMLKAKAEAEARAKEKQAEEEALLKKQQQEEAERKEKEAAKAKKEEEDRLAREAKEKEEKEKEAKAKAAAKKEELRIALEKAEEAQAKAKKAAAEAAAMTAQQDEKKAAAAMTAQQDEKKAVATKVVDAEAGHQEQQNLNASTNATQAVAENQNVTNATNKVSTAATITKAIVSLPNSSQNFAAFGHSLPAKSHPAPEESIIKSEGKLVKAPVTLNASASIPLPSSNATVKK
jgi:hypothetical protein